MGTRPSRAKPVDQLVRHRLVERDLVRKIGLCRVCGPVDLVYRSGAWLCGYKNRNAKHEHLLTRYGLTEQQYDEMLAEQDGLCAICGDKPDALHVDHDDRTGKVRGLLCGPCNRGLGLFYEDPVTMQKAIDYLHEHS